jgi:hypothetical protein
LYIFLLVLLRFYTHLIVVPLGNNFCSVHLELLLYAYLTDFAFCCFAVSFPSLIVFDGHEMGLPVASSIQQKETADMIADFLTVVKAAGLAHQPDWKPSCFIIDCAPPEVAALKRVFPDIPILFCSFHVRR